MDGMIRLPDRLVTAAGVPPPPPTLQGAATQARIKERMERVARDEGQWKDNQVS